MGSREQRALMTDPANCFASAGQMTGYLLPKNKRKKKHPPIITTFFPGGGRLWIRAGGADLGGVGIIHLQPGRGAGAGCLPRLALKLPAGSEGLGMQPAVCPSPEAPMGLHCSSTPQKCTPTRPGAQMFHSGAVWRLEANHCKRWHQSAVLLL